jgi:hypothetical protein
MAWQIRGEYFETCSCDYVCPCISSNLMARPTQGWCVVALVQHIDQGQFNDVTLDGLNFVVVARTPEEMGKGNWSVGLIVDERANAEQKDALAAIASGQAGGPMAALGPLIGNFLGVESRAVKVESSGNRRSVSIPDVLDQAVEGMTGANGTEPMYFENVGHPVSTKLALAKSMGSHVHAFGIDWDNTSGNNNGHYSPFEWRG